jgi:hypothetical protein
MTGMDNTDVRIEAAVIHGHDLITRNRKNSVDALRFDEMSEPMSAVHSISSAS